jgi:hypothetical protein
MNIQEALEMARKFKQQPDTLAQRGIPKDWVCVIHPVLYKHLLELIPQDAGIMARSIEQFTRRKTYVDSRAEMSEVHYMPEQMYQMIYGEGVDKMLEAMFTMPPPLDVHLYGEPYNWNANDDDE